MLTEDTLFLDYLTYASAVVGAGMIVMGLIRRHMRWLMIAGIVLPSAALAFSVSETVMLKFDVVIVTQPGGLMSQRTVRQFVGGEYVFDDGKRVRIAKPQGGPIGTVVVNDTDRQLRIVRVSYTSTPRIPGPGGDDEIAVIEPGGTGGTLKRIGHFGPEAEGPPGAMKSLSSFDTIDWLTWK